MSSHTDTKLQTAPSTFMFVDLTSYSAFVSSHSPEQVAALLCRYYEILEKCAAKYAAELVDSAGDGVAIVVRGERNADRAYDLAMMIDEEINVKKRLALAATVTLDFGEITEVISSRLKRLDQFFLGNTLNRVGRMAPLQSRLGVAILTTDEFRMQLSLERRSQFKFYRKIAFRGLETITSLYYVH